MTRRYNPAGRAVLTALLDNDGATPAELVTRLHYARSTVSASLNLAYYDGLIEPGERPHTWRLTAAGVTTARSFT